MEAGQSTSWYSKAVRTHVGCYFPNPRAFLGKSTGVGAISAARDMDVPESLICLQTGHGQQTSVCTYMKVGIVQHLYKVYESLGLDS